MHDRLRGELLAIPAGAPAARALFVESLEERIDEMIERKKEAAELKELFALRKEAVAQ